MALKSVKHACERLMIPAEPKTTTTTILLPVDIVVHFDEREPAEKDERGDVRERVGFNMLLYTTVDSRVVVSFDTKILARVSGTSSTKGTSCSRVVVRREKVGRGGFARL